MTIRRGWIELAVVLGSGVVFLDGTIVNVALETIGQELPATVLGRLEGLTYVNTGYLAVLAALLILAGAIGDRYGRRRTFAIGMAAFGTTSVICGLAPSLEILVIARLIQGAAGALLVPGALAILTATFSGEERGRAIGLWAASTAAMTLFGPLIGGVLVQSVSWRAAFLINVPLIALGLYAMRYVPESRDEHAEGHFDILGALVVAVGVGGLAFGATRGQQSQWQDTIAFVALAVGVVATASLPFLMAFRRYPLVPLSMFRSREFSVINLSTFVIYGALYMNLTFQILFLQGTLGYTPLGSGLATLPVDVFLVLLSTPAGRFAARFGPRRFLVGGPGAMALGLLWLARVPATSPAWAADIGAPTSILPPIGYLVDVLPAEVVFGFGLSVMVAPLTTALMASIPTRRAGLGSAINNAVSRVGAPLVGAALFIAVTASFYPALEARVPGLDTSDPAIREQVQPLARPEPSLPRDVIDAAEVASTDAFHLAMVVAAGLLVSGAVINGLGLRAGRQEQYVAAEERRSGGAETEPAD